MHTLSSQPSGDSALWSNQPLRNQPNRSNLGWSALWTAVAGSHVIWGEPPDADDIVQQVFLRCGHVSDDYQREVLLQNGWLAKGPDAQGRWIAPNDGYWVKAIRRTHLDSIRWWRRRHEGDMRVGTHRSKATKPPSDYVVLQENWEKLKAHLKPEQIDVLEHRIWRGLELEQCAAALGITSRALKGRLYRTLAECYRILLGD